MCAFLFSGTISLFAQGSLTPPGAPTPTMKTLQQIEPRIDLQATPAPPGVVTTDANYHFIINQPGSYYLSANLLVTKANGIQIAAEGVTVDLNGFQISRAGGTGNGIEIAPNSHRAGIRHGSIKGFAYGVLGNNPSRACVFRDLAVSGCTNTGIQTSDGAVLESCRASDNSGIVNAIYASPGSTLSNCTVTNNTGSSGIVAAPGCVLINCSANNNTVGTGISADTGCSLNNCSASGNAATNGIRAIGSTLTGCTAVSNISAAGVSAGVYVSSGSTVTACTASFNYNANGGATGSKGIGIRADDIGSTITNCTASGNTGDGIQTSGNCGIIGNTCDSNGAATRNGAGIHVTGSGNRIDSNHVLSNDRGIDVDVGGNLIIRNSARGNKFNGAGASTNYVIAADNRYGDVQDDTATGTAAVSGDSAGGVIGTNSPWANIAY
jgi:parallel beta-helix repeat protein